MQSIYFVGIGGIGMSALARYYLSKGYAVAGYDLTPGPITEALEREGAVIHFEDNPELIPPAFQAAEDTIVVYTPAIPAEHRELNFLRRTHRVLKRSELLGQITRQASGLCVAGTHGKTTTSTLLAHLLHQSHVGCSAFLGGISNNYQTNLLLSQESPYVVIEADEFDRSFHQLSPHIAVITSADPDHLDIYGTAEAYRESFEHFTSLIQSRGALVLHRDVAITPRLKPGGTCYTYSSEEAADFYASDIEIKEGRLFFTWHYPAVAEQPAGKVRLELGVPLRINVDNAVAALAVAYLCGAQLEELTAGLSSFRGVHRRFDRVVDAPEAVLIDDYAHHPEELRPCINSVRALYPGRQILGIFQPHLYSRTQDFYREFAEALSGLDEVILLDIYPAREAPIPGVSSQLIASEIRGIPVQVVRKEELLPLLEQRHSVPQVTLMVGAGDIDRLIGPVADWIRKQV